MPGESPRIIVVEDDAGMSQAIERILWAGGYTPQVFESAEALLAADAASSADCLVLDIHLPGISGFELYHRLSQSCAEVPVIFMTGHDEPAIREQVSEIEGSGYLAKPFSGQCILDALHQALCL